MIGELLRHKHFYRFAGHGGEGEVWECVCGDWEHRPCPNDNHPNEHNFAPFFVPTRKTAEAVAWLVARQREE